MDRFQFSKAIEFHFDSEKSKKLKKERGFSFEEVIDLIGQGAAVHIVEHPNLKYSHQHICEIVLNAYVYILPFVVDGDKIFLKTLYPSRKATKLQKRKDNK